MVESNLTVYRENLEHVVRPENPTEREKSNYIFVSDSEALSLARALETYTGYETPSDTHRDIAMAYIEYINLVVREEKEKFVYIYAHTEEAIEVLDAVTDGDGDSERSPIRTAFESVFEE